MGVGVNLPVQAAKRLFSYGNLQVNDSVGRGQNHGKFFIWGHCPLCLLQVRVCLTQPSKADAAYMAQIAEKYSPMEKYNFCTLFFSFVEPMYCTLQL